MVIYFKSIDGLNIDLDILLIMFEINLINCHFRSMSFSAMNIFA